MDYTLVPYPLLKDYDVGNSGVSNSYDDDSGSIIPNILFQSPDKESSDTNASGFSKSPPNPPLTSKLVSSTRPNVGPTELPPKPDATHADQYLPPYDASDPPSKQVKLRYDPKTASYVAIGQWDERTGQWHDFDANEFKAYNQGNSRLSGHKEEKNVLGTTHLLSKDSKTGKWMTVGFKVNGKAVYLSNPDMAQRANGIGTKTLGDMPKFNPDDKPEFWFPPPNADGSQPKLQYLFRLDQKTGMYEKVAESRTDDKGNSTQHEYSQEEFIAANQAVENNYATSLPPEDPDHPDFRSKNTSGNNRWMNFRYIDGRYQLVGYEIDGQKLTFDAKTRADINADYVAPKPRDQIKPGDLAKPAEPPMGDQTVPPTGKPGTTSYIFRYHPGTDCWYMMGESTTDESGKVQTRMYDDKEFTTKNQPDPTGTPPDKTGEFQALNSNLICAKDPSTGTTKIIGMYVGNTKYYFESSSLATINASGNVAKDYEANDPLVPTDTPPKAGEGAKLGHPDFNSKSDREGVFIIWRWDDSVKRYCAVGEYSADSALRTKDGKERSSYWQPHVSFVMYTNEEYRSMNSGPNRKVPPSELVNYQYPVFAEDSQFATNVETVESERIALLDSPNDPPKLKGQEQSGTSVTGFPIYKKLANGDRVIVGIKIEPRDDGRMSDSDATRIHYFSQNEFEYYNPGGKATTNNDVLHAARWESFANQNLIGEFNQPSYDTNGKTSGHPQH